MKTVRLGRSGLIVTKPAMGCLPLQRCTEAEAVSLLRNAYDGGIRYFDTANAYTDSEEKIGKALSSVRENIVISTKSMGRDGKTLTAHIEESLRRLRTDYIDLFQFHLVREPFGPDSELYEAALKARDRGLIRHIGATAHNVNVAETLVRSGMFETMQYPFSYISNEKELALAGLCAELDVGFIAMKGLAGGLITNARACTAFMNEYPNVVPIWGIQRQEELREWLALGEEDPALDEELRAYIAKDAASLSGSFCRGCGYCMPCPVGIPINTAARMDMLLRRAPWQGYVTPEWKEQMERIENCLHCGHCVSRCPYELDTPALLRHALEDYRQFCKEHAN